MLRTFLISLFLPSAICYMKIAREDNDLVGLPTVACGVHTIDVMMETKKPFSGQVYTKGYYNNPTCRTNRTVSLNTSYMISLSVPISDCGIRRQRTLNPPGILLETTVILMFHKVFLTKDDKSFKVQCHYAETDTEVTKSLDVSTLLPTELPQHSEQLDQEHVPFCKYEVLTAGVNGRPVKYATVGEDVYHRWSCDVHQMENMYCMTVHSCTADNGQGIIQNLIDERGCSLDEFLIHNLNYSLTELSAGQHSNVFKFADQPTVFFSCMVRLFLKDDPETLCPLPEEYCSQDGINSISNDFPLPPQKILDSEDTLIETSGFDKELMEKKKKLRKIRDLKNHIIDLDVSAPSVDILDMPYKGQEQMLEPSRGPGVSSLEDIGSAESGEAICISRISVAFSMALVITVTVLSIIIHFYLIKKLKGAQSRLANQTKYRHNIY